MTSMTNSISLGENAVQQIIDAADRDADGELKFLIKEEMFSLADEVEIEDFLKSLDIEAVIHTAVEEFRTKFTELLNESIQDIED
jgi:hypothetical protein